MRTSEQINAFWGVARESSVDGERFRRRIGAGAAMTLLVCGFLLAIGLSALVLAFFVGVLVSVGVIAFAAVWPRVRARVGDGIGRARARGRRRAAVLVPRLRDTGRSRANAVASASRRATTLVRTVLESGSRAGRELAQAARSTAQRTDPQRDALRLNAAGTRHRRNGLYDEAVECHRRALELLRSLDDRRGIALTQSNLALALSHAGDDDWAIGLFEEAAATLRELGDEEHEAQIMANLGLAHRRHGRPDEGNNVLELALTKLSPASSAYQTIEAELRRAS